MVDVAHAGVWKKGVVLSMAAGGCLEVDGGEVVEGPCLQSCKFPGKCCLNLRIMEGGAAMKSTLSMVRPAGSKSLEKLKSSARYAYKAGFWISCTPTSCLYTLFLYSIFVSYQAPLSCFQFR